MDNKVKLILTAIGLGAVIVPAVLLTVFSSGNKANESNVVPGGNRQINQDAIQKETQPTPAAVASPTPSASKAPTVPLEGTPQSGVN